MEQKTIVQSGLSLSTIGILTGIVLSILQGVGTINIGWFWATFPFWITPAIELAIFVVALLVTLIVGLVNRNRWEE